MKQEIAFIKREPVFEKRDWRELDKDKDVMVIKQEEPWHQQLLRQQQLVSPQLEKQRVERRALVDKLLRDMAGKNKTDQQPNQQGIKQPLVEDDSGTEENETLGTSIPMQVLMLFINYQTC